MQPANILEEAIEKMELYCSTWRKDEVIGHKLKQALIEYKIVKLIVGAHCSERLKGFKIRLETTLSNIIQSLGWTTDILKVPPNVNCPINLQLIWLSKGSVEAHPFLSISSLTWEVLLHTNPLETTGRSGTCKTLSSTTLSAGKGVSFQASFSHGQDKTSFVPCVL